MTKFSPDDDEHLIQFLRQHRPEAPSAAPDLEEQIMQAVASSPQPRIKPRHLWVVPPAIAASVLLTWAGYRILTPPPVDPASLEAFLENSWNGAIGEGVEAEPPLIANIND